MSRGSFVNDLFKGQVRGLKFILNGCVDILKFVVDLKFVTLELLGDCICGIKFLLNLDKLRNLFDVINLDEVGSLLIKNLENSL
jgi:hypothetical protein